MSQDGQSEPKGIQRIPKGPKGRQREPKGSQRSKKESKVDPREAKGSQREKLYIKKLLINRPSGRYVTWLDWSLKGGAQLCIQNTMYEFCARKRS